MNTMKSLSRLLLILWLFALCGLAQAGFSTPATLDTTAPSINTNPQVSVNGQTSVTLGWSTSEISDSRVSYRPAAGGSTNMTGEILQVTQHLMTLTKLTAATTYRYTVESTDPSGNTVTSAEYSFTTAAPSALNTQTISTIIFSPATLVVGGTTSASATGGNSGNAVTFTSMTTGVCTVSGTNGSTVTGVTAGTCTLAANQAGNSSYSAAAQVMQSFSIGATTVAEPIVPEVPVVPLIPPLTSLPALPGVGNSGRVFLNLAEGAGPSMTGCLRTTLNDILGPDWQYQGQSADGGARLSRATENISFYPIDANTNTAYGLGQGAGIYLRNTNPLSVVTGCGTFLTAPALYSLGEFGALLNAGGLTAQINAQGVITYPTGTLTYAVRPNYLVTQGTPGAPALTTGSDGHLRFTDSTGHSQILYPAFLDPELLGSQVSQAVGGWTVIQTDGTALVTLWDGRKFVLTPDLALGSVPPGTMTVWWQDGPNHYSFRNSGFSNTSQGFSVSPR